MRSIFTDYDILRSSFEAAKKQVNEDLQAIGKAYTELFEDMYMNDDGMMVFKHDLFIKLNNAKQKLKEDRMLFLECAKKIKEKERSMVR